MKHDTDAAAALLAAVDRMAAAYTACGADSGRLGDALGRLRAESVARQQILKKDEGEVRMNEQQDLTPEDLAAAAGRLADHVGDQSGGRLRPRVVKYVIDEPDLFVTGLVPAWPEGEEGAQCR